MIQHARTIKAAVKISIIKYISKPIVLPYNVVKKYWIPNIVMND